MKKLVGVLIAVLFVFGMVGGASATLIDFEELITPKHIVNETFETQGYDITHSGGVGMIMLPSVQEGDFSGNGTTRLMSWNNSTVSLTTDDSLFDFLSFEGGESWTYLPHLWSTQIAVIGYKEGSQVQQVFDLDLIKDPYNGMETFNLNSSFTELYQVDFYGIGGNPEFSLDNIEIVSSVPEPSTILLMGAGILGLAGYRRKWFKKN